VGLLTCDPAIGADLSQLFNYLTGYGRNVHYGRLLVAPQTARSGLEELIRNEIRVAAEGGTGGLVLKMNSLVDEKMIRLLYEASEAGVQIDLIVRGMCCLVPGVPGQSTNIRARSIVGRYLEHSRIYRFANGSAPGEPSYLIGSADFMRRNLDRRVEALVPVREPHLQGELEEILRVNLADDTLAWELGSDGVWRHVPRGGTVETHERLQELALARLGPPA
jgi:polyphosphate kinase